MRRIYSALTLLFISLLFLQCQREVSHFGGPDNPGQIVTPDPITTALQGNIFDENGAPAAGVTITAGNKTAITDAKGFFRINGAMLDKNSAVVTASKSGYFKAYRTFGATSGSNHVEIKLVKRTSAGNIDAAAGGEVALSNGTKVALPANGVVNAATNAAYTGQVKVYASYIDPSAADIAQTVPGSFMANDKDGKRVVLTSYGMVAVELEGVSGEKLQVKSGTTATLTTAIPAAAQSSAPATIPLWSVDETTGVWKEEGTATKNGNVYVGQVSHFSFWNCDVSVNAVKITLKLQLTGGESFVHAQVRIKRSGTGWNNVSYGKTDSIGQVSGYVPYNEPLILEVLDQCGQPFYSQNIGPYTQNTNLGTITVSNPGTSVVTLKGKLLTCSNTPVTGGFAIVNFSNYTRYVPINTAGEFQTTFTQCAGNTTGFTVIGVDTVAQQQSSTAVNVALTSPITDAGNISACGAAATQFVNYTLDGVSYSMSFPSSTYIFFGRTDSIQVGMMATSNISVYSPNANTNRFNISFRHQGLSPGTYQLNSLAVENYSSIGGGMSVTITQSSVVINNFPQSAGQYYEGSLSSTFRDSLNANHTLTGTFRILRQ